VAFSTKGAVDIPNKKCNFCCLFFPILLLVACSQSLTEEEYQDNSITGQATATEILRACKYPSGRFCEEMCCQTEEKCGGGFVYMVCDLKTGEWADETYSDSECASECEISKLEEGTEDKVAKENKTVQSCPEGWKCLNKFERIYRNADCSFGETEKCSTGCVNDTCAKLCSPNTFSCRNDVLRKCNEDANDWIYFTTCDYGCENEQCLNSSLQTNQTQNTTQPVQNVCTTACFSITNFHYDAEGNDNNNENDEYVTIKNSCLFSCDLAGWEISDDDSHKYSFAGFDLGNGGSFTIHTGEGTDTESKLYWNRGSAVWNNDGDTLYLKNQSGETIFSHSYQ